MKSIFQIIFIAFIINLSCFKCNAQSTSEQKQLLIDQYNTVVKGYANWANSINKPILDSAIQILYQIGKLDSTDVQVYIFLAKLYDDNSINKIDSALKNMSRAIKLNDTCFSCYKWRALS